MSIRWTTRWAHLRILYHTFGERVTFPVEDETGTGNAAIGWEYDREWTIDDLINHNQPTVLTITNGHVVKATFGLEFGRGDSNMAAFRVDNPSLIMIVFIIMEFNGSTTAT